MSQQAEIGVTGLAVMGRNLARNFARHGHVVAIHNRTYAKTQAPARRGGFDEGTFIASESLEDFVASLARPRKVIIMVKAGPGTDAVIDELVPLLEEGDIVVDAGNAHFPDTIRREQALAEHGLHFVGSGVSGGEEGALNGPVDHAGRVARVVRVARPAAGGHLGQGRRHPVLHLRRPRRRRPLRQDGAQRHRVRRHAADRRGVRPHPPGHRQEPGRDRRHLHRVELRRARVVPHRDHRRGAAARSTRRTGKAFVDVVLDQAEQKGTGRWTVQNALDLGVPITGIAEATFARALSGSVPQREAAARRAAGRHRRVAASGRRRRLRRGRPARAVRLQGRRLLAGLRPDRRGQPRVRLGHRPRRDGPDLARRLHHPRPLPEPHHRGLRARRATCRC